jgi:glycosyltransferase involved in cell wall biosynthesis
MAEFGGAFLSVVIPTYNSGRTLERCLSAIAAQPASGDQLIVVDDGSTDDVGSVANQFRATLVRLDRRAGAAAARNRGADLATRPVLLFVDADVILHPDAIARGRVQFVDPSIDAVIGSYDSTPEARTLVSRFKNLAHHYFHQRAAGRVGSFWCGCGFIKRVVFEDVGGFDENRFTRSSIEDVELGWRVTDRGGQIVLDPHILATHLKEWTLRSLVMTDVLYRAVPWVRWSLERRRLGGGELNASRLQQVGLVIAVLLVASGLAAVFSAAARVSFAVLGILAFAINRPLFQLFWRSGGARLLMAGFVLQQLYYLCALAGLLLGILRFCWQGRRSASAPPARVGV